MKQVQHGCQHVIYMFCLDVVANIVTVKEAAIVLMRSNLDAASGHLPEPPEPKALEKLNKQLQQLFFDSSQSPSNKVTCPAVAAAL